MIICAPTAWDLLNAATLRSLKHKPFCVPQKEITTEIFFLLNTACNLTSDSPTAALPEEIHSSGKPKPVATCGETATHVTQTIAKTETAPTKAPLIGILLLENVDS